VPDPASPKTYRIRRAGSYLVTGAAVNAILRQIVATSADLQQTGGFATPERLDPPADPVCPAAKSRSGLWKDQKISPGKSEDPPELSAGSCKSEDPPDPTCGNLPGDSGFGQSLLEPKMR
jgi:hypothetical protein